VDTKPSGPERGGKGDWTRALREAAPLLGLGSSLAFTLLLSLGAGYWLDGRLGTRPIFFLVFGAFGLFAAGYNFVRAVTDRRP
jgi:F0F1-type ATP synthase assembly protein I